MKNSFFVLFLLLATFLISCDDESSNNDNNINNINNANNTNNINNTNNTTNINNINNINNTTNTNNINNINNTNNSDACNPNPCIEENYGFHYTLCTLDTGNDDGFSCGCEEGFVDNSGYCELEVWDNCPTDYSCLGDYCVEGVGDGHCITNEECHENLSANEGNPTTCNSDASGGICIGCRTSVPEDCPTGTFCNEYAVCVETCDTDADCPHGRCNTTAYVCQQIICMGDADCPMETHCVDEDSDGDGFCKRIPCVETECSIYNEDGDCPTGEACLNGGCVGDCDPNPCLEINRTTCTETSNGPQCGCDDGYSENPDGDCVPDVCPTGFSCTDGYCVDPSELFMCVVNSDCGGTLTCSPDLPTGTCNGCGSVGDCPSDADTCLSGYCLRTCSVPSDCAQGMECKGSGYCGFKTCNTETDCQPGYTCDGTTNKCHRITCS